MYFLILHLESEGAHLTLFSLELALSSLSTFNTQQVPKFENPHVVGSLHQLLIGLYNQHLILIVDNQRYHLQHRKLEIQSK